MKIEGVQGNSLFHTVYAVRNFIITVVLLLFPVLSFEYLIPYPIPLDGGGILRVGVAEGAEKFDKEWLLNLKPHSMKRKDIEGFLFIKGGCYQMGDTFGDGESDEKPVHEVCVDDFYMEKYEVTQKEWVEVMGNNPSYFKGCDNCPVEQVSWNDVQEYIRELNQKTGKRYRLPTEAEWEYAARSGGKREKWAGTSNVSELGSYAWYTGSKTHPVGQKKPNGLGLYDMAGNVWEWVQDWYGDYYYGSSPKDNPEGPSNGRFRVLRGGSWDKGPRGTRSADRYGGNPDDRVSGHSGFRCVLTP
jgi:formylglycine-generating enzyme required for sulfatase activity